MFEWTIKVSIDPDLVSDGLDLSDPERVWYALCRAFPLARSGGIHVEVTEAPNADEIRKEQGS